MTQRVAKQKVTELKINALKAIGLELMKISPIDRIEIYVLKTGDGAAAFYKQTKSKFSIYIDIGEGSVVACGVFGENLTGCSRLIRYSTLLNMEVSTISKKISSLFAVQGPDLTLDLKSTFNEAHFELFHLEDKLNPKQQERLTLRKRFGLLRSGVAHWVVAFGIEIHAHDSYCTHGELERDLVKAAKEREKAALSFGELGISKFMRKNMISAARNLDEAAGFQSSDTAGISRSRAALLRSCDERVLVS
jgi:hypothetical protein